MVMPALRPGAAPAGAAAATPRLAAPRPARPATGSARPAPVALVLTRARPAGDRAAAGRGGHHRSRRARRLGPGQGARPGGVGGAGVRGGRVRRRAVVSAPPGSDARDGDRGARAVQHRPAVDRGAGGPVHHVLRHRRVRRRGRRRRRSPARHRRPLLLARVLRPMGVVPRRVGRGRPRRGAALVPAGGGPRVGHRGVRAGPVDARRHPCALGRGVAVRRAELDRAGLLLAAGDRHRPAADGADLRARTAGDPPDGRGGGAGLAAAAPRRPAAAAAAPLDRRGDDAAEPADAAAPPAAAHLLLCGAVPARAGPGAPAHPVRDHRPADALGRGRPFPRPGARARRDPRRRGVHHHRRPRLLDEPDRAPARQRRRRQRP